MTLRLTRSQLREVDRLAVERYALPGIVLMENAALGATEVAWEMLIARRSGTAAAETNAAAQPSPGSLGRDAYSAESSNPFEVLILCGGGNNGGDGLAVARHLHNRGAAVHIGLTVDPDRYNGDALINWNVVRAMRLPYTLVNGPNANPIDRPADLIVDAIFGTGLSHPPRDPFATIVQAVNSRGVPVLSIDIPSGLDCDSGLPLGACIRATQTVTFVAEKTGFAHPEAAAFLGKIHVAGIGCPRDLIAEVTPPTRPA